LSRPAKEVAFMPLNSFGSILNFAEEMERLNLAFYERAVSNPACADHADRFRQFAKDDRKHIQTLQRTRRENVTEMILEPIHDFYRAPYVISYADPSESAPETVLEEARKIEQTAELFYRTAVEKIRAQPEVARILKVIGKNRTQRLQTLTMQ
jgi:rubrerythrin